MRDFLQANREMRPLLKDGRLWNQLPEDLRNSTEIVLSAFKSHRNPKGYSYLSMPITSGKLFYDILDKYDVHTLNELIAIDKDILYNEIILPNITTNTAVADRITTSTEKSVIAPAVFEAKKQRWSQEAYMFLWYRVLEEVIDQTIMTNHWEYSNGGVQEFVRAHEIKFGFRLTPRGPAVSDLPIYFPRSFAPVFRHNPRRIGSPIQYEDTMDIVNEDLDEITLQEGAALVANAIADLEKRGFDPTKLKESLQEIGGLAECFETYHKGWAGHHISMPWNIDYTSVYDSIRLVEPKFLSCSERR